MYLSKKSTATEQFNSIIGLQQHSRIKAIFALASPSWNHHRGFRTYSTDEELYILFENDWCLIINYRFIDFLDVEFRKLTESEIDEYEKLLMKDCFNTINDMYDFHSKRIHETQICKLEYDSIESVSLRSVTDDYSKWIGDELDFVSPTEETFDEIKFVMSNGKSFVICADDAYVDGYAMFWSEDTKEEVIKK